MNINTFLSVACGAMLAVTASAGPEVDNVVMKQDALSRIVTVTYDLGVEPAIITLDILTNGVSIGAHNIYCLSGDVNRMVYGGPGKSIKWKPHKSWTGNCVTNGTVQARVKAWTIDLPPDYMVVDLTGSDEPRFYECEAALPGGISNNYYRTTAMVMRRIPADGVTWTMGSSGNETGGGGKADREWQHPVTMDHDYYMAVFEMTQGQYYYAIGQKHDKSGTVQELFQGRDWMMRPLAYVRHVEIRDLPTPYASGSTLTAEYLYPAAPMPDSILGKLRAKTGIMFELPSEAEWEYACRAGTGEGFWNDGTVISKSSKCPNLPGRASYKGGVPVEGDENYGMSDTNNWTTANGTAIVGCGRYPSNKWGLYDMHGNVWEWCNDFYYRSDNHNYSKFASFLQSGNANAKGDCYINGDKVAATERYRVRRGGCWESNVEYCRSAARNYQSQGNADNNGLRLVCPVGADMIMIRDKESAALNPWYSDGRYDSDAEPGPYWLQPL